MNVIINFPKQQVQMVELGRIPHAIRPRRADNKGPEPGDLLYLYAGLNTVSSRLIRTEVCEYVQEVTILQSIGNIQQILLGNTMLDEKDAVSFASSNGYVDDECLVEHIKELYGLPFTGNLIGWENKPEFLALH